jgi:hypothetical protein
MIAASITALPPATSPVTPLPIGPEFWLPSGCLGVQDQGWLISYANQWVMAVAVAPDLFFVSRERTDRYLPTRLYHELLGYLVACGCWLLPVEYRCPWSWRQATSFTAVQTEWIAAFFNEAGRMLFEAPPPQTKRPRLVLPLADLAADAAVWWDAAGRVADALSGGPLGLPKHWREMLSNISRRWEAYWNHQWGLATRLKLPPEDEFGWLPRVDAAWSAVVRRHLLPHGYRFNPGSLERLL